jgi:hypothetical protein
VINVVAAVSSGDVPLNAVQVELFSLLCYVLLIAAYPVLSSHLSVPVYVHSHLFELFR